MISTRAIHFAATASLAGMLVFRAVVAGRVLRNEVTVAEAFRTRTQPVLWVSLLAAVISGVFWFFLQAASMSGRPLGDTAVLSIILNDTQFGQVAEIRFAIATILMLYLVRGRFAGGDWLAFAAGLGLISSLAWAGHAGSTDGEAGQVHVVADALHLGAAAVWIGGLLSLVLFFAAARSTRNPAGISLVREVTGRFSVVGMASVAALSVTGVVNAYFLVGSFHALMVTEYGRLLLLKLIVFAVMLTLAATNRFLLTPRLDSAREAALRWLSRNSAIELALGLAVIVIVGMLGTLHPASHLIAIGEGS